MRLFNTVGPVIMERNYFIPPLDRINRDELFTLIDQWRYFVLHAPRQTGKTSLLLALCDELNAGNEYRAVYVNVESAQVAREDVAAAIHTILGLLAAAAEDGINDSFVRDVWQEILATHSAYDAFQETLRRWSASSTRPLILMIDEIDKLVGDSLISVLRQLRSGYVKRPNNFPQSVILCGIRDVRDYRIHSSSEKEIITGGSAFNIKTESLRLSDFDENQSRVLLLQHTEDTGQCWSEAALNEVCRSTQGQPWLVNALAHEAWKRIKDRSRTIKHQDILKSREELILRRDTHLDQLVDKLREDRVKRVIEPLVSGLEQPGKFRVDDLQYVRDLGLISRTSVEIANPIYREIIPRELITSADELLPFKSAWFVEDGRLVVDRLMSSIQEFFREHSEHWVRRFDYQEAGPQLLLQAFLQRIVSADGRMEREYGLGRLRTDLLVVWGMGENRQKVVIECKLRKNGLERTIQEGLKQTCAYMERCGTDDGHLVIFDRSKKRSWDEKVFMREELIGMRCVKVWGM